jgi:hypothetical protein
VADFPAQQQEIPAQQQACQPVTKDEYCINTVNRKLQKKLTRTIHSFLDSLKLVHYTVVFTCILLLLLLYTWNILYQHQPMTGKSLNLFSSATKPPKNLKTSRSWT